MQVVGDADVDRIDIRARDQLPPVGLDRLVAPAIGESLRLVAAPRRDRFEDRFEDRLEGRFRDRRFFVNRFDNFAFFGVPFAYDYAAYGNGCWRWDGWQWINICYNYDGYDYGY